MEVLVLPENKMTKELQERWYQVEASQSLFDALKNDSESNPVVVIPTGGGKTIILCQVVDLILTDNPYEKVLIVSHDKRILRQNHEALEDFFEIEIGLYCSGLGSKEVKKITVASIQSIYKCPQLFRGYGRILVDECHLVTIKQSGMYRSFLDALGKHQVGGLTATDFRTGHGYIHKGKGALFNEVAYDLSSTENFNRLVTEGYLSELYSKPTAMKLDTTGLKKLGGDFNKKDMSVKLDRDELTESAVLESCKYGKNYKRWLCFAIDIAHAENIKDKFISKGIEAACVHSKSEDDDEEIIKKFKEGEFRVLIGIGMLTTGLDIPDIDMIILLRPTSSCVLHIQMIGRGLRTVYAENYSIDTIEERLEAIKQGPKQHCLVLDFAGNVSRLGPINNISIEQKEPSKGTGQAITKECPECTMITYGSAKECENCGHEFEFKELLKLYAEDVEIISKAKKLRIEENCKSWSEVDSVSYHRHIARVGSPEQIVAVYKCGLSSVSEYININHKGYAKHHAKNWIAYRWKKENGNPPKTINEFFSKKEMIMKPKKIFLDTRGKYPEILDAVF